MLCANVRPSDPLCGVVLSEEQNLVIQEAYSHVDFLNREGASYVSRSGIAETETRETTGTDRLRVDERNERGREKKCGKNVPSHARFEDGLRRDVNVRLTMFV